MIKEIVVFANSVKHGNSCVAENVLEQESGFAQ